MLGNTIIDVVNHVTKPWAKQRKAEERDAQSATEAGKARSAEAGR